MATAFKIGETVEWNWGGGTGAGVVRDVFTERVERTLKGATVVRDADDANPAYLIEQDDGAEVLKSQSELTSG